MECLVLLPLEYTRLTDRTSETIFQTNTCHWKPIEQCQLLNGHHSDKFRYMDNLDSICTIISELNSICNNAAHVSFNEGNNGTLLMSVTLRGDEAYLSNARLMVLRNYNRIGFKKIKLSNKEFKVLNSSATIIIQKLVQLAAENEVEILISNEETNFKNYFEPSDSYYIYILGFEDNITQAEIKTRALMDYALNNFLVDTISVDLSCIPLIGGIDLSNFTQIAKQSRAKLYIPDLLPELFNSKILSSTQQRDIILTGKDAYEILLAKDIILNLKKNLLSGSKLIQQTVKIDKTKIDLLTLHNQSEILNIMSRNGTFIQLPCLGEMSQPEIIVQGINLESVESSICEITNLSSKYYTIIIKSEREPVSELQDYLEDLVRRHRTCILSYNNAGLKMSGVGSEIKFILQNMAANYYFWKSNFGNLTTQIKIGVRNDQKDFISGKKNGKIIKVMNAVNNKCTIKYERFSEWSFNLIMLLLDESPVVLNNVIRAIHLIELELQAELKFNIPDVFHKSIIGNGGCIIQSIMKKYNVFIKFSSEFCDLQDSLTYSFVRTPNVLIKCPTKNAKNIFLVKQEIDELVSELCLSGTSNIGGTTTYFTEYVHLWRSHYLLLLNKKGGLNFVNKFERETNTFIDFPETVENFGRNNILKVAIKGSEKSVSECAKKLRQCLPKDYIFKLTYCPKKYADFLTYGCSAFVRQVIAPLKVLLGIEVTVLNEFNSHHELVLSYLGSSANNLEAAIENVTQYLREKGFLILEKRDMNSNKEVEDRKDSSTLRPITNNVISARPLKYITSRPQRFSSKHRQNT